MGLLSTLEISTAALDVQQVRLEVMAANLANAQTTKTSDGKVFRPLAVVVGSFADQLAVMSGADDPLVALPRPVVTGLEPMDLPTRRVHNPGHPDADINGFVTLPGSDPVGWTIDLIAISRHYEANLRAFDITRNLVLRTLEIGRQS